MITVHWQFDPVCHASSSALFFFEFSVYEQLNDVSAPRNGQNTAQFWRGAEVITRVRTGPVRSNPVRSAALFFILIFSENG